MKVLGDELMRGVTPIQDAFVVSPGFTHVVSLRLFGPDPRPRVLGIPRV